MFTENLLQVNQQKTEWQIKLAQLTYPHCEQLLISDK